jgi:tRNA pseudouridine55 synthase
MEFSGILIIDKPAGVTSHDVVAAVRRLLQTRQVGHFGTLDPFATGVLPISVGKATRFAQFYLKSRKAYEGVIEFSFSTDTYDATGKPTSAAATGCIEKLGRATLEGVLQEFTGRLPQTPPPFSAKRVGGVRAYELARAHKPVDLVPVPVEVYALEVLGVERDRVRFAVECSGGTYVRSLAHDIGQRVGCPAHLAGLRRTAVAEFKESQAVTLQQLEEAILEGKLERVQIPLEALLPDFPELVVRGREEQSVRHGHTFELAQAAWFGSGSRTGRSAFSLLKIMSSERRLIAIARHVEGSIYHPDLVLV